MTEWRGKSDVTSTIVTSPRCSGGGVPLEHGHVGYCSHAACDVTDRRFEPHSPPLLGNSIVQGAVWTSLSRGRCCCRCFCCSRMNTLTVCYSRRDNFHSLAMSDGGVYETRSVRAETNLCWADTCLPVFGVVYIFLRDASLLCIIIYGFFCRNLTHVFNTNGSLSLQISCNI